MKWNKDHHLPKICVKYRNAIGTHITALIPSVLLLGIIMKSGVFITLVPI